MKIKEKYPFQLLMILITCSLIISCKETRNRNRNICSEKSIWRDKNGIDSCSFYTKEESCEKILGKLSIIARLHKGLLEKDVFEGGGSSRWFIIKEDYITYYTPEGEIADQGNCNCENGTLTIDWEIGKDLPRKCDIYFNSDQFVELRYYDYPYDFNIFKFDKTKAPENPTKIIGNMGQ